MLARWHFNSPNFNFVLSLFAAYIRSNQIMGWGEKAIEIRSVETGHLDGVFMHKRAQRLKFLCERNDKVRDRCDTTDCVSPAVALFPQKNMTANLKMNLISDSYRFRTE